MVSKRSLQGDTPHEAWRDHAGRVEDHSPMSSRRPSLGSAGLFGRSHGSRAHDAINLVAVDALEHVRKEYALRRLDAAERLLVELDALLDAHPSPEAEASLGYLLRASTLCLRGRIYRRANNRGEDARQAFARSSEMFAQHEAAIEEQRLRNRFYTDFGIALHWLERYADAERMLRRALESSMAPAEAFAYHGFANDRLGHSDIAEEALRKGLALLPGDVMLLVALGNLLARAAPERHAEAVRAYCDAATFARRSGDAAAADAALRMALQIAPTDSRALDLAVDLMQSQGLNDEAQALVDTALALDPGHALARGLKAILLRDRGDFEAALGLFNALHDIPPELAWLLVEHGRTLWLLGPQHRDRALTLASQARDLDPREAEAFLLEAEIISDEDVQRALSLLQDALRLDPGLLAGWLALARLHASQMAHAEAYYALERVFSLDPTSVPGVVVQAGIRKAEGDTDGAADLLRVAVQMRPGDFATLCELVDCLWEAGRTEEALLELDQQIEANPGYWQAHWKRGSILAADDRMKEAVAELRQASSLCPDHVEIQIELGDALLGWGAFEGSPDDFEGASGAFARALALAPSHRGALERHVMWLCLTGNYLEAQPYAERFVAVDPEDSQSHLLLGQVLRFGGAAPHDKIEAAFRRALDLDRDNALAQVQLAAFLLESFRREDSESYAREFIAQQQAQAFAAPASAILPLLSWAQHLLRNHDEALRLIQAWTSSAPEDVGSQFDRALILLASGRSVAIADYIQLTEEVRKLHRLRQRGLFYVALWDLVVAATHKRVDETAAERVFAQLHDALASTGLECSQWPWLGQTLAECAALEFARVAAPQAEQMLSEGRAKDAVRLLNDECSPLAGGQRWLLMARAFAILGNDPAAANALYSGLACASTTTPDPLRAEMLVALGTVLERVGRIHEARQVLAEADEIAGPADPQFRLRMALTHLRFLGESDARRTTAMRRQAETLIDQHTQNGGATDLHKLREVSRELAALTERLRRLVADASATQESARSRLIGARSSAEQAQSPAGPDRASPRQQEVGRDEAEEITQSVSDFAFSFGRRQRAAGCIEDTCV